MITFALLAVGAFAPAAQASHGRQLNTLWKKSYCGSEGAKCCLWDKCESGLTCVKDGWWKKCMQQEPEPACGDLNWPCCPYGDNGGCFKGDNLVCSDDHKCIPQCGWAGEDCCEHNSCDGDLVCDGGKCKENCGGLGEQCCEHEQCDGDLKCEHGSCKAPPPPPDCGDEGQKCCDSGDNDGCYKSDGLKCSWNYCKKDDTKSGCKWTWSWHEHKWVCK